MALPAPILFTMTAGVSPIVMDELFDRIIDGDRGMVFSVEPGLYIPTDDEDADPRFRGIGVRIEDDIVVTERGHEVLTEGIPKEVADVEAACA